VDVHITFTGCWSYSPAAWPYTTATTLDADLVVVGETSMMDVILANKLIKAIPEGAHLLLVGDVDQLPSSVPAKSCATCSTPTASRGCA
jgi:ATP-dependent exoDNAse (exonuclease V) alpha subunit